MKILANIEIGDPDRIADLNRQFYGLHNLYNEILVASRTRQTADERILQAQFASRVAFVSSQIQDLDFATHRAIIEHGIRIGNTAAECIIEADTALQVLSDEIGQELMAIASIARRDFLRIPNEFVHPTIEDTEIQSQSFLSQVIQRLSNGNPITGDHNIVAELEALQEEMRNNIPTVQDSIEAEVAHMQQQMNYVKAEVFPILEYSSRYFRQGADAIVAGLENCN